MTEHTITLTADRDGWLTRLQARSLLDTSVPTRIETCPDRTGVRTILLVTPRPFPEENSQTIWGYTLEVICAGLDVSDEDLEARARNDAREIAEYLYQPSYWDFTRTAVAVTRQPLQIARKDDTFENARWRPSGLVSITLAPGIESPLGLQSLATDQMSAACPKSTPAQATWSLQQPESTSTTQLPQQGLLVEPDPHSSSTLPLQQPEITRTTQFPHQNPSNEPKSSLPPASSLCPRTKRKQHGSSPNTSEKRSKTGYEVVQKNHQQRNIKAVDRLFTIIQQGTKALQNADSDIAAWDHDLELLKPCVSGVITLEDLAQNLETYQTATGQRSWIAAYLGACAEFALKPWGVGRHKTARPVNKSISTADGTRRCRARAWSTSLLTLVKILESKGVGPAAFGVLAAFAADRTYTASFFKSWTKSMAHEVMPLLADKLVTYSPLEDGLNWRQIDPKYRIDPAAQLASMTGSTVEIMCEKLGLEFHWSEIQIEHSPALGEFGVGPLPGTGGLHPMPQMTGNAWAGWQQPPIDDLQAPNPVPSAVHPSQKAFDSDCGGQTTDYWEGILGPMLWAQEPLSFQDFQLEPVFST